MSLHASNLLAYVMFVSSNVSVFSSVVVQGRPLVVMM